MRRSSHVLIGLCIAAMAVAISFYCAPPPNEPTVNPPPTAAPDNTARGNTLTPLPDSTELKIPEKDLTASTDKPSDEINPNDPAFQHIRNQLKIDISMPKHNEDLEVLRASGLGKKEPLPELPNPIQGKVDGHGVPGFTSWDGKPIKTGFGAGISLPPAPQTPEPDKAPIKLPDMPEMVGGIKLPDVPTTLPENIVPNMITNQKMHKLKLAVDQVGKSGITNTEIQVCTVFSDCPVPFWVFKVWDRFPNTPKEIDICLKNDGVYMIRPVFISGSGKATDTSAGETLTLILDTVKPKIELEDMQLSDEKASLNVSGVVSDQNLDSKSLVMEYTEDGKTWKSLAKITDDTKASSLKFKKEIPLPKDLNTHIFVRMTVKDLAGNVATEYYPKRIAVDTVVPKGRLMLSSPVPAKGWWDKVVPLDPIIQANWWNWGNK